MRRHDRTEKSKVNNTSRIRVNVKEIHKQIDHKHAAEQTQSELKYSSPKKTIRKSEIGLGAVCGVLLFLLYHVDDFYFPIIFNAVVPFSDCLYHHYLL